MAKPQGNVQAIESISKTGSICIHFPYLLPWYLEDLNGAEAGSVTKASSSSRPVAGASLEIQGKSLLKHPRVFYFHSFLCARKQLEKANVLCRL